MNKRTCGGAHETNMAGIVHDWRTATVYLKLPWNRRSNGHRRHLLVFDPQRPDVGIDGLLDPFLAQ